ncbi:cold regulated gene 27 [Striga asiatica]|uniref:Cold regulated gene 27 n=1 Tax=Striga asiatica TaxID=4170 RepID=A0A5A7NVJ7_STRAF|nr:cold regulated gene 27 [Striga asiatica]
MSSSGSRPRGRCIRSRSSSDFCLHTASPVWTSAFSRGGTRDGEEKLRECPSRETLGGSLGWLGGNQCGVGGEKLSVAMEGGGCDGVGKVGDRGFVVEGLAGEDGDCGGMRGGEVVGGDLGRRIWN